MDVYPAKSSHLCSYKTFLIECYQSGLIKYEPAVKNPKTFLTDVISDAKQTSTYFCIKNGEVLGAIRFRHFNNDYVEKIIGHIGYETKPSARGKGVAKFMLSWIQKNVMNSHAVITCELNNEASETVILGCGGIYQNEIYSTEKQSYVKRFNLPYKQS